MRIIGTVTKNVFTFSASLAIQKNMSVYSLFTVSIIRYGRYAIGARINVKCYNIVLPLTASTAKSVLLCRSLLPSTADTLRIIFLVDKDSYIVINYDKTHYFSNPQIKTACILSFVIYSSFTDYRIVNKLVTCFSSSIYGFLYMRSKKEFSYYNVPLLVGFSLRTTAIRFYARIAISSMSRTFIHPMYTPGILPRRIVALPFTGFTKYVPVYTSASLSFYESSIVEINKIAVNGKRVFRNSTSSRKPKFSNTTMIFLDDNSSTRSRYISRLSRRRGYLFRRSRRILRKVVRNRYVFRRFSKWSYRLSFQPKVQVVKKHKYKCISVHRQRFLQKMLHFVYSLVLRDKVRLRLRAEYPFDKWIIGQDIKSYNGHFRRLWEHFICYKVNRSVIRNLRRFVKQNFAINSTSFFISNTFNSLSAYFKNRYKLQYQSYYKYNKYCDMRTSKTHDIVSVLPLYDTQTFYNNNSYFFISSNFVRFSSVLSYIHNSRTYSSQSLFFLHLFLLSKHSAIVNVSLLRLVYQSIEKIDMCIRTVLELSGYHVHDYVELCSLYKNVLSSNFVYYYRPYISDIYYRTILRVPSDVGRDVISNLPNQYKSLLRKFSYSTAKLNRYKKFLLRNGILQIPTFSFLDGFFSGYTNANWNKRAFSKTFSLIKLTTRRSVPHGLPLYQSASTYVILFYLFLYSYVFVRKRNNSTEFVANTLLNISRISLFSVYSLHLFNSCSSTVGTSTAFLNSFLSRTSSLFHINIKRKASSINLKLDYINIRPFFHGDSIVFFKYISHNSHIIEFRCSAALTNYSVYYSAFIYTYTGRIILNIYWNCLNTRPVVSRTLFAYKLRSNMIRARLISQSCAAHRIISDKIFTTRFNRKFITLKKKARKYFSMSRRHYQHKWYSV